MKIIAALRDPRHPGRVVPGARRHAAMPRPDRVAGSLEGFKHEPASPGVGKLSEMVTAARW